MPVNDVSDRPSNLDPRRSIARMVGIGIALAILTNAAFFVTDLRNSSTSLAAFREVALTMPRLQVDAILAKYRITCTTTDSATMCVFSDSWRTYTLAFDRPNGSVVEKQFYFRQGQGILRRLISDSRRARQ
jgi:hypothetical protein